MTDRAVVLDRVKREFSEGAAGHFLGARLEYCENGVARVRLPYRQAWEDGRGDLGSGVVGLIAEVAGRLAVASASPFSSVRLMDLKINYLGWEKEELLAIGEVVLRKPSFCVCRFEVLQRQDRTVAMGLATYNLSDH